MDFPSGHYSSSYVPAYRVSDRACLYCKKCCKKAGGVNLIPVAVNYPFLREDKPEVLCEVGEPIILTDYNFDRKEFTHRVEKNFEALCDKQFEDIRHGNIEDYEYLYKQKLNGIKNSKNV